MSKRILVFTPTPTHPQDHGNRKRVYAVCDWLARRGHEIHLAYYPFESDWRLDPTPAVLDAMRQRWYSVDVIYPRRKSIQTKAKGYYHKIDEWWDPAIGTYLEYKFAQQDFAACIVNYSFFSKAFKY